MPWWGELNNRVDVFEEERFMLREESKLAAIGLYVDQLEEGLDSFVVTRRDIYVREERCTNSKLETARLGEKIDYCSIDSGLYISDYIHIYIRLPCSTKPYPHPWIRHCNNWYNKCVYNPICTTQNLWNSSQSSPPVGLFPIWSWCKRR